MSYCSFLCWMMSREEAIPGLFLAVLASRLALDQDRRAPAWKTGASTHGSYNNTMHMCKNLQRASSAAYCVVMSHPPAFPSIHGACLQHPGAWPALACACLTQIDRAANKQRYASPPSGDSRKRLWLSKKRSPKPLLHMDAHGASVTSSTIPFGGIW